MASIELTEREVDAFAVLALDLENFDLGSSDASFSNEGLSGRGPTNDLNVDEIPLKDDLLDALLVVALRTPNIVEDVDYAPSPLNACDLAALAKLSENLAETIVARVDFRNEHPLLFFENANDFKCAFEMLVSWDAVFSRSRPNLIECSRMLTEEELMQLPGVRKIDFSTDLHSLPKDIRHLVRSMLWPKNPNSSLRGDFLHWDSEGFLPPG